MFILRQISTSKQVDRNQILGDHYYHISKYISYEEFKTCFRNFFEKDHVADLDETSDDDTRNCFGFISYEDGSKLVPLFNNSRYYIMTDSGKTFTKLTGL